MDSEIVVYYVLFLLLVLIMLAPFVFLLIALSYLLYRLAKNL